MTLVGETSMKRCRRRWPLIVGDTGWMDEDFSEVVFRPVDDAALESSLSVEGTDRSTGFRDGLVAVGAFVLAVIIVGFVFYDRSDGEWQMTIGAEAPISSRTGHVSVWTGSELVVWGGWRTTSDPGLLETLDDGAAYDPATDTWRLLAPSPLVGRVGAGVVWTGTEMLVLATQQGGVLPTRNGAAYNPATDTWRILPEFDHTLGWSVLRTVNGTGYLGTQIRLADRWFRIDNETGALTAVDGEGIPISDTVSDLVPGIELDRIFVDPVWTGTVILEATGGFDPNGDVKNRLQWRTINPSTKAIVNLDPQPDVPVRVEAQGE